MSKPATTVAIVLASAGRPALLGDALRYCAAQQGVTFLGVVSVPDERSLPEDRMLLEGWQVVTGVLGLAAQRNAGIDALDGGADVVVFFDDDAVVREDYVANTVRFFDEHPQVLALTGRVLLDGKLSGEIDEATARSLVKRSVDEGLTGRWKSARELYGANFAVRLRAVPDLRFDERLPLYSWLEDHDVARRLLKLGPLARVDDCVIVHRAAASGGRENHARLGYSQVMNAVYLQRKGSFPTWLTLQQVFRPVAKNVALSVGGGSRSWRRERLRGNLLGATDVVRGRITPERILVIHPRVPQQSRGCRRAP